MVLFFSLIKFVRDHTQTNHTTFCKVLGVTNTFHYFLLYHYVCVRNTKVTSEAVMTGMVINTAMFWHLVAVETGMVTV